MEEECNEWRVLFGGPWAKRGEVGIFCLLPFNFFLQRMSLVLHYLQVMSNFYFFSLLTAVFYCGCEEEIRCCMYLSTSYPVCRYFDA